MKKVFVKIIPLLVSIFKKPKMKIIDEKNRKEVLLRFGLPNKLITAINTLELIDDNLLHIINYPNGAYFYLPTIKNYSIYEGYNVVPICDSDQGDSFYTLLFNDIHHKIIYNCIEEDKIYINFGYNIQAMIANVMIEYYDLMDDAEAENREAVLSKISELGAKIGGKKDLMIVVIKRIFDAEDNEENRWSNSRAWFDKNIIPLLQ